MSTTDSTKKNIVNMPTKTAEKRYDYPIPYGWYCVSYSTDLKVGDVKPLKYFGRDLVLFRTEDGTANLMDPFCPHLGAHLGHGGVVKGNSIQCPFHGWKFDGKGQVTEIPYAKKVPPKVASGPCIHSYPTVERNGFVWGWYHPNNEEPNFEIDVIPELNSPDWTDLDCYDWTVNSIVQELGENAVDGAHFVTVHGATTMPVGSFEMDKQHRTTKLKIMVPAMDENGIPDLESGEEQETDLVSINVGPGMAWQRFSIGFDTVLMLSATPIDDQSVHLRFAFSQPKDANETVGFLAQMFKEETARQVEQDMPIWNHKMNAKNPVLCDGDGPIAKYRKWFSQFYVEEIQDNSDENKISTKQILETV